MRHLWQTNEACDTTGLRRPALFSYWSSSKRHCGVRESGSVWLKKDEQREYVAGTRVFGVKTHTTKVRVQYDPRFPPFNPFVNNFSTECSHPTLSSYKMWCLSLDMSHKREYVKHPGDPIWLWGKQKGQRVTSPLAFSTTNRARWYCSFEANATVLPGSLNVNH